MTPFEEQILFFRHLGAAFSAWGNVENSLRNCVVACFGEDDRNSLSLGFFSIENFRSKLAFADKVIHKKLVGKPLSQDWTPLVARARAAAELRNALAHKGTQTYKHGKAGRRIVLVPWIYKKPKRKTKHPSPPPGSLGVVEIVRYYFAFYALTASLMNFCHRVLGVPEQFPKDHELAKNPPPIERLARLMHAELGHLQKSSRQKHREEDAKNAAASLHATEGTTHQHREGVDLHASEDTHDSDPMQNPRPLQSHSREK